MESKKVKSLATKMKMAIEDSNRRFEEYNLLSEKEKYNRFLEYMTSPLEPKKVVLYVSPKYMTKKQRTIFA